MAKLSIPSPTPASDQPTSPRRRKVRSSREVLALEPRIMFDGAALSTAEKVLESPVSEPVKREQAETGKTDLFTPQAIVPNQGRLILVSASLPQAPAIQQQFEDKGSVVLLDPSVDALAQIHDIITRHSDISELHIISHGEPGSLLIGESRVDSRTLQENSGAIKSWQAAFKAGADILLYGCDIGAGERGQVFVRTLVGLTGADIEASTDDTGSVVLGGNEVLELRVGDVQAHRLLDVALLESLGLLLTDTAPPVPSSVKVGFDGANLTVTVNLNEPVSASTNLSQSTLSLTTGGIARSATYVAAESDLTAGKLVYRYTGTDFTQGLQLGQITLNGAVISDAAGNALVPSGLNPSL
ncbi:MAG: Soluble aldose sugar dehydrogenase YliI precursor, partial [Chloroflexota bacterium]